MRMLSSLLFLMFAMAACGGEHADDSTDDSKLSFVDRDVHPCPPDKPCTPAYGSSFVEDWSGDYACGTSIGWWGKVKYDTVTSPPEKYWCANNGTSTGH